MFMKLEETGHSTIDKQSRKLKWSGQILIRIPGALGKRVQHELKAAWICTEETGCFKGRVREQGMGTAGVWTESGPQEAHLGCSPELIKVRPLPTHGGWERGPPCRCWLEQSIKLAAMSFLRQALYTEKDHPRNAALSCWKPCQCLFTSSSVCMCVGGRERWTGHLGWGAAVLSAKVEAQLGEDWEGPGKSLVNMEMEDFFFL